jgi:hypothetical protein
MKKVMFIILLNLVLWFGLTSLSNVANANDYNKAVISHVIKEKLDGNGVDHTALMEQELNRIVYAMINEFSGSNTFIIAYTILLSSCSIKAVWSTPLPSSFSLITCDITALL